MTVKSIDVAKYILDQNETPMTTMKLQKLVFYSHAWHLVWKKEPLVSNEVFQAWENGPVSYLLFDAHRGKYVVSKEDFQVGDPSELSDSGKEVVDVILSHYGKLTGGELSELTHAEEPWLKVRTGLKNKTLTSQDMSNQSIVEFYSWLGDNGTDISKINWISKG